MSGGDGNGYNSGAHDTGGNINGGPTGIGGGGTNSGDGWHIDKDGTLHIDITEGNQTQPGPGKEGNGNGGDGSNSSSSNSVTVLGNSGYVNMAYAGVPAALYPVSGVLTISLNWSATTAAVREAIIGLDTYLGDVLTRVAPYAGRFLGVVIGSLWPSQIAPDPQLTYNFKDPQVDKDTPYSVIALPAELVTTVPVKDIPKNTTVPARVLAQAVIDELAKNRPVTITPVKPTPVPVVRAQKTDKPNIYTAQVIPGMKPMRIYVTDPKRVSPETSPVMPNSTPAVKQYLSPPDESCSHHAILDFGGDHAPVYISVTKQLKPEEEKKQAEEVRKEWITDNPAGVSKVLADLSTLIDAKNKQLGEKQKTLNDKQAEFQAFLDKYQHAVPFVKKGVNYSERERTFKAEIGQINADISSIQKELTDAAGNKALNEKTLADLKEQERNQAKTLEDAEKELTAADTALAAAGSLVTEKEKQLADKRQALMSKQAEFQPFLDKYQDEGKFVKKAVKFDEKVREFTAVTNQLSTEIGQLEKALSDAMERRSKAEGKKNKAEKAKETAVVKEQTQKINNALSAPDVMVLDEKNLVSLSVMGRGITNIPQEIKMQVGLLSASLSVERELRLNEQMYGSGKNIQSVDLLSFSDDSNRPLIISSGSGYYKSKNGYVEKYTRGKLISKDGVITLRLYFDALNDDPGKVRTLNASKDKDTGLYSVMLPSPFGTILINPEKPPVTAIPPLGIPVPDIRIPLNTGTNIDVIAIPDVPGTPVPDDTDFNDYVIIFPADSGINPIYIMLNSPGDKTPELKFDEKIKGQMSGRGWTEQDVKDTVAKGPKGKSFDKRSPKKTPPDHLGRNDTATVYGKQGEYVVVNDRTGEVVQVSDRKDPEWADDSRIQWEKK